jgi:hypothetical protein
MGDVVGDPSSVLLASGAHPSGRLLTFASISRRKWRTRSSALSLQAMAVLACSILTIASRNTEGGSSPPLVFFTSCHARHDLLLQRRDGHSATRTRAASGPKQL